MFKITPVQDKAQQMEIAKLCARTFRPDALAYQMFDIESGELMGFAQFDISECGYIYDLCEPDGHSDFEAMFILGRQTMNFIDSCGAHICRAYKNSADSKLLHAIGFRKSENDDYFTDMTGMFDGHCDGHEVKL